MFALDPCELTAFITAAAVAVSKSVTDDDELSLLAAVFTQFADTLATIAVQRSLIEKRAAGSEQENSEEVPPIIA